MTHSATATATRPESVDQAIALADALQSGFAAQRSGCQRSGTSTRTATR
jgi:hypothetical protein